MAGAQALLQYNDYLHDPLSQGTPAYAISSRYDLRTKQPLAFGGIDTKVTSDSLIGDIKCSAISGPTHQQLPPFVWTSEFADYHEGLPTTWNFDWVEMKPEFM